MLTNLSVHNFALFEKLVVDFKPGFNVLTGETGAGKSILIDAFNIAMGGKASTENIRSGADFFVAQAVFDLSGIKDVKDMLDELGIAYPDNELIMSRKIVKEGKNISTANGIRVPGNVLKALGEKLVDVHGQYENQQLLKTDTYIALLDSYMDDKGKALLAGYKKVFYDLKDMVKRIEGMQKDAVDRERSLDILNWEIEEIENSALKEGEDTLLEEKSRHLANIEKITGALSSAYTAIDDDNARRSGLLPLLGDLKHNIDFVAGFDESFAPFAAKLDEMKYEIAELKTTLAGKLEDIELQSDDIEVVEQRLDTIYKLKKKYGKDITSILSYYEDAKEKRALLLNMEESSEKLEKERKKLQDEAESLAGELTAARQKAASDFSKKVLSHIHDLAMPKADFVVSFSDKAALSDTGKDEVRFLFSANAGQEAKPLNKVASGGELSRIALSIKTVLLGKIGLPTMVFDEIDTGVGGSTAQKMAEKIAIIASEKQVLCITHLPQIACMADCHIYLDKKQSAKNTWIEIDILDDKQRVNEIARMIAGDDMTELAKGNAEQMIELAQEKKKSLRKK